jgi:hypothetical protein
MAIYAGTDKSAQVVFSFGERVKAALAGELKILSVGEVDLTLPSPRVRLLMFHEPSDKFLVTVRIDNAVSMAVFIINWHVEILVSQKHLINWQMDAPESVRV